MRGRLNSTTVIDTPLCAATLSDACAMSPSDTSAISLDGEGSTSMCHCYALVESAVKGVP